MIGFWDNCNPPPQSKIHCYYKIEISLTDPITGVKAKTGWLGIGVMCPCLSTDYCFCELAI